MRSAVCLVIASACGFAPRASVDGGVVGDGNGDLDAPVITGEWWNAAYGHRQSIVISTNDALVAGFSIEVPYMTAKLVTDGQALANGYDWRIVRHTPAGWVELDRWIDDIEGTGWNGADTRTWFKLPVAVAAGASDSSTYIYYNAPTETAAPPTRLDHVFLFGDDFEGTLGVWALNQRMETASTQSAVTLGGAQALLLLPGVMPGGGGGIHKDIALPAGRLRFSQYLRQEQTTASLGHFHIFTKPYAMRQKAWNDPGSRLFDELDSTNRLHNNGSNDDWFQPFGITAWHHVEMSYDQPANKVIARADGGAWTAPMDDDGNPNMPLQSIAIDGEGQGGVFQIDNYTIRFDVLVAPVVSLGVIEAP